MKIIIGVFLATAAIAGFYGLVFEAPKNKALYEQQLYEAVKKTGDPCTPEILQIVRHGEWTGKPDILVVLGKIYNFSDAEKLHSLTVEAIKTGKACRE